MSKYKLYHISVKKFEIGQILHPIEPIWVSSDESISVVREFKKGIFLTEDIDTWYYRISGNSRITRLYIHEVEPSDVYKVYDCSIRYPHMGVDMNQWFATCDVTVIGVREGDDDLVKQAEYNLLSRAEYEYYTSEEK